MVAKSNKTISSQQVTRHLERLIVSHRQYFADWRSNKFASVEEGLRSHRPSEANGEPVSEENNKAGRS